MKYDFILFDLDNTLFDYNRAEKNAFSKMLEIFCIEGNLETIREKYHKINLQLWQDFEKNLINAQDLRIERFRRFCRQENFDFDPAEMSRSYLKFLSEGTFLIENAVNVVSSVADRKIALITNGFSEVQYPRLINSALSPYFNEIFISEEIGYSKPHPAIFEFVFKQMSHKDKNTAIIIGDSLNSDIKGGNDFGIATCWFNIYNHENKSDIKPDYEISELIELLNIIRVHA
ncbi:MAG: YjjG family noncanonical pyrimidine nucleotidase [Candidatus Cloacimonadota bacterium]|nr:YjjG family noncanonical pyrimidine nucleotidase [Candidatus Cloacimonadota bacterium]